MVVTIGQFDSSLESGQSSFPSQNLSIGIHVLLFWHSNSLSVHPKNSEKNRRAKITQIGIGLEK